MIKHRTVLLPDGETPSEAIVCDECDNEGELAINAEAVKPAGWERIEADPVRHRCLNCIAIREFEARGCSVSDDLRLHEQVAYVELRPRQGFPDHDAAIVEIGLTDVRAADSVRVLYDFERDGWVIQQASRFSWAPDEKPDRDWQEVAFIQAWGRMAPGPGGD